MILYVTAWAFGVASGVMFSGAVFAFWLQQDPKRLGLVVRWIVDALARYNGGLYIKMYVALFDTRRASKVMAYVKPEDLAEAIGWYAVKKGYNADPACEKDPRSGP